MEEQYLVGLTTSSSEVDAQAAVTPNIWLLSSEEVPPILFSPEDLMRLLGLGRARVYELLGRNEIRSIKLGRLRKVSARALSDYVAALERAS